MLPGTAARQASVDAGVAATSRAATAKGHAGQMLPAQLGSLHGLSTYELLKARQRHVNNIKVRPASIRGADDENTKLSNSFLIAVCVMASAGPKRTLVCTQQGHLRWHVRPSTTPHHGSGDHAGLGLEVLQGGQRGTYSRRYSSQWHGRSRTAL